MNFHTAAVVKIFCVTVMCTLDCCSPCRFCAKLMFKTVVVFNECFQTVDSTEGIQPVKTAPVISKSITGYLCEMIG